MAPDPKELVPGNVAAINETVTSMSKLGTAFENAGQGFKKISTTGWKGPTADAFGDYFQHEPPKWLKAADAFTNSSKALGRYRDTLEWAQKQAEQACARIERADKASEQAANEYNAAVERHNAAVDAGNGPVGGMTPFQDPGAAARAEAQAQIEQAQQQVAGAASEASAALKSALQHAPPEPGWMSKLGTLAQDTQDVMNELGKDVVMGAFEGALELNSMIRTVNPVDFHNLTHPLQYAENLNGLVAGLFGAAGSFVSDPVGSVQSGIAGAWNGFTDDPGTFVGKLVPEAALGVATGGGGTAASIGSKMAREAADLGMDGMRAARHADDLVPSTPSGTTPSGVSPPSPRGFDDGFGTPDFNTPEYGFRRDPEAEFPEPKPDPEPSPAQQRSDEIKRELQLEREMRDAEFDREHGLEDTPARQEPAPQPKATYEELSPRGKAEYDALQGQIDHLEARIRDGSVPNEQIPAVEKMRTDAARSQDELLRNRK